MKYFFKKFKIIIIIIFIFFPFKIFAQTCSPNGYTILTINGVSTNISGAQDNRDKLKAHFPDTYNNQKLTVDYLLNPTHTISIDLLDTAEQKANDETLSDIQDSDFAQMLTDASAKVITQKLLLVGHSQGNFYANTFYDAVIDEAGGIPSESMGVYGVATPANRVAGNGLYLTSDTDKVIDKLPNILKPNVHIDFKNSDDNGLGHDFSKIYLTYQGDKIVSDIKTSLNKLKNNNVQSENVPCISPPRLTLAQKVQGAILATLDGVVSAANKTTSVLEDGYMAFLNNTGAILANVIGGLASKNGADVISAVSQPTDTSPNLAAENSPITTNENPSSQNILTAAEATPPLLPQATQTAQATPAVSPAVVRQGLTAVTSESSQNLYPDLLPGGGGVAASNVYTPPASSPPLPPDEPLPPSPPPTPPPTPPVDTPPPTPSPPPDTTPPVITILGNNPEILTRGSVYTDAGATALDNVDGTVSVGTTGAVDTTTVGVYTITYAATDAAGNTGTATRTVVVASYKYIPKNSFGKNNGDGNDWLVWSFAGSNVYDWSDTYVDNYLREQFKIQTFFGGGRCSQCLQRGIFNHDPQKGFGSADVSVSGLEGDPQNEPYGITYDVVLQWDSAGYTYDIYHDSIVYSTGHTNVANVNGNMWVGWDGSFNNFKIFPDGIWRGVPIGSPLNRPGGDSMMLQPYPVYNNQPAPTSPMLSLPNKDVYAGTGINPTRGRTNLTPFTFQVIYTDENNNAPQNVRLHATNGTTGISLPEVDMRKISAGADTLSDGNFANGEAYIAGDIFYDTGDYSYYFTAKNSAGNEIRIPENDPLYFGVIPSTYTYIPKDSFGAGNGDGNDWEVWTFAGSDVYDWSDTYVNNYLLEQFKVQAFPGGTCSQCLQRGIFSHDPQKGFESADVSTSRLEGDPQNSSNGFIYGVTIQWDSTGYEYTLEHNSVIDFSEHIDVPNMNNDLWVGWDGSFNNFQTFPSGTWVGASVWFPVGYSGGMDMVLQPYPVYVP
jgi:hypothetical protein